jgi:hypothetical protein
MPMNSGTGTSESHQHFNARWRKMLERVAGQLDMETLVELRGLVSATLQAEVTWSAATDGSHPFEPKQIASDPRGLNLPERVASSEATAGASAYRKEDVALPPHFLRRLGPGMDAEVDRYEATLRGL